MAKVVAPYCKVYVAQCGKSSRFWNEVNRPKQMELSKDVEMTIAEQDTKKRKRDDGDDHPMQTNKYQKTPIRFVPKYQTDK